MTAEDLKNSILQLAIQGKLVEQREEEGTAEELYQQIQKEKAKLIKEGKIKKSKPLPPITEDEIPFEIPKNWKWVRFSEVLDVRDGTHDTPKYVSRGIPLVTSKNLDNGRINFENVKTISHNDALKINQRSGVDYGDILFAMIGSIGNPVLVETDRVFSIKNMALFKSINHHLFSMKYLLWYLQLTQDFLQKKAAGGVQSFVSLTFLRKQTLPLPPLKEQKRIVAKIEELMPFVKKYDKSYTEIEKLNKQFPEDMKKSILQYAIQGKLVEQRDEEGTAEELYQQIQKEKSKLIKEGKIKKSKPLPSITEDEIPFTIPESWKWVRLGEVAYLISGKQYKETQKGYLYLKVADMNLEENKIQINTSTRRVSSSENNVIPKSSIIFPKRGGAIATNKKRLVLREEICIDSNTMSLTVINVSCLLYIHTWFSSKDLGQLSTGTSVPQINNKDLYPLLIPLPPLKEQKRIVAKIEELMPFVKHLNKE